MYRSYTQNFRIFGAVIIFLRISKVAALFKIQKIKNLPVLSPSLSDRQDPHVSDTERERGGATDSGQPNVPAVRLRRGRRYLHDQHHPTNLPDLQNSSRHTGGSSTPAMASTVTQTRRHMAQLRLQRGRD